MKNIKQKLIQIIVISLCGLSLVGCFDSKSKTKGKRTFTNPPAQGGGDFGGGDYGDGGFAGLTENWNNNKPVIVALNGHAIGGSVMVRSLSTQMSREDRGAALAMLIVLTLFAGLGLVAQQFGLL